MLVYRKRLIVALGQKYGRLSREKESAAAPLPPAKPVAEETPRLAEESPLPVVGKVDLFPADAPLAATA